MAKNSISLDEIKDMILSFAKVHPGWAAIGAGVGCGSAYAIPKLAPTIEFCFKYSVDKVVDRLPKAMTRSELTDDGTDTSAVEPPDKTDDA